MAIFHDIELEIIRPGPAHNQLLSPITIYTALCGESAPVDFSIDLEQHQLNERIARLRYVYVEGEKIYEIPQYEREVAIEDLGNEISRILAKLQNLLFETGRAFGQTLYSPDESEEHLIHLRLVSSAAELANIPLEVAVSPPSTPSEGRKMLLDLNLPVVLTREIRRTRRAPVKWDRDQAPTILIISAQPGLMRVPIRKHVRAIRESLEPWIEWPERVVENGKVVDLEERVDKTRERITVIHNASIEKIRKKCAETEFTHVHILAHGGEYEKQGEKRFGIILCDDLDDAKKQYVSGEQLAILLQAESVNGKSRSAPTMVTLATCDSAAQGSLVIPGGSIAYDLHHAGIPWVIASQFPLSKKGSVEMAKVFYPRVFRGDDPRKAIFETRRILYTNVPDMHDWASLIVYANLPSDFNDQVANNFANQSMLAHDIAMNRADYASGILAKLDSNSVHSSEAIKEEFDNAIKDAESYRGRWRKRLPSVLDNTLKSSHSRGEFYGVEGSGFKREALFNYKSYLIEKNSSDKKAYKRSYKKYQNKLSKAVESYDKAINEWVMKGSIYHWTATQYLSLKWALSLGKRSNEEKVSVTTRDRSLYMMARELAESDFQKGEDKLSKSWASGSLAELALLSLVYGDSADHNAPQLREKVEGYCQTIIDLVGRKNFAVVSTRRQFERYVEFWLRDGVGIQRDMLEAAKAAIRVLESDDDDEGA